MAYRLPVSRGPKRVAHRRRYLCQVWSDRSIELRHICHVTACLRLRYTQQELGEFRPLLHHLRQMGSDTARALVVLALVFLSFAHAPVAAAQSATVFTAGVSASYCGDMPDGDGKAHAPCHACRIGGIDLPPPPATAVKAAVALGPVSYFRPAAAIAVTSTHISARPRAPPALI